MTTVVASSALCRPSEPAPGWVAIDHAMIIEVGAGDPPRGATDLGDLVLAPGFLDLQCNGVANVDLACASADDWQRAGEALADHGVTAYLATFVSAELDAYAAMLTAAETERSHAAGSRAELLGVHLEGPFLGGAPGAHEVRHLRPVDLGWLASVRATWPGLVQIVTLAPEADDRLEATRALSAAGVVVALGHTAVSYEEAVRAIDAGASVATHLFNGMTPFHHRNPGLAGAALTDDRVTPTLIADLVHVHPAAVRIALACKPDTAVVSDAVGARGQCADGAAWLPDGTLAGATTLLDGALANLVRIGFPLSDAVAAVTTSPARIVGASDRGVLEVGAHADLVALDPRDLRVVAVWLAGERKVVR